MKYKIMNLVIGKETPMEMKLSVEKAKARALELMRRGYH